jgi:transposase
VGYIYQQALARTQESVEAYAVKLAQAIADGVPLVYFDEASFNLWLRNRRTWSPRVDPVKYPIGRNRGAGITVMGAISQFMGKPIFTLEKSTNSTAFQNFLRVLRQRFKVRSIRLYLVLDNAKAHTNKESKLLAEELNIELLFMPPYTPEFNCIEALWSVLKRDFKRRVLEEGAVSVSD